MNEVDPKLGILSGTVKRAINLLPVTNAPCFLFVAGGVNHTEILAPKTSPVTMTNALKKIIGTGYAASSTVLRRDESQIINSWSACALVGSLSKLTTTTSVANGVGNSIESTALLQAEMQKCFNELVEEEGRLDWETESPYTFMLLVSISPIRGREESSGFGDRLHDLIAEKTKCKLKENPSHRNIIEVDAKKWIVKAHYYG